MAERTCHSSLRASLVLAVVVSMAAAACGGPSDQGGGAGGDPDAQRGQQAKVSNGMVETAISLPEAAKPKRGGSFTYGLEGDTDGFDPTVSRWVGPGLIMANAVFDPLAAYAADGSVRPYLAEKIEPADNYTIWTITLRPDVRFTSGEVLDADALALFFQKMKASPLTAPVLEPIDAGSPPVKVDQRTVRLTMTAPWAQFPVVLTGQGGMVPAPSVMNNPDASYRSDNPIGTGPFKLKSRQLNVGTIMDRNPDYWQKDQSGAALPYLDSVAFKFYADPNARDAALEKGDVNMEFNTFATSAKRLTELAQQSKLQVIRDTGAQEAVFLALNMDKEPTSDLRIRQAIAYATDRDTYVKVGDDDPSWISYNVFSTQSPWYVETEFPHYDQAKARALVDEYVKEKGPVPPFTVKSTDAPGNLAVAQKLVEMYKAVGLPAAAEAVSISKLPTDMVFGQYDIGYARLFGSPDPDGDYYWFVSKNAARLGEGRLGLNLAKMRDPQIDALLEQARTTTDLAVRKQAYRDFQKRLNEVVPYVWLTVSVKFLAADNRVRAMTNGPLPDGTTAMPVVGGVTRLTQTWLA